VTTGFEARSLPKDTLMRDNKFHKCIIITMIMRIPHDGWLRLAVGIFRMDISRTRKEMKQSQIDLVRRFNRTMAQKVDAATRLTGDRDGRR
jgi:hypothetical protein